MKTLFERYLNEDDQRTFTIYHGDNYNTKKLDPKLMFNGNNQEGVGIYFGDRATGQFYGNNIISIDIDQGNYVDARGLVKNELSKQLVDKLYLSLCELDKETTYYAITDWGIDVDLDDITEDHILMLAEYSRMEEVRNFQIDLVQKFGVLNFVKVWNTIFPNIHGTYNEQENFWCVINTDYKVTKVN